MSASNVAVRLSLDGVGQVASGVKSVQQSIASLGDAAGRAGAEAVRGFERIDLAVGRMRSAFGTLAQISIAGLGLKQVADMADAVTNLSARLALATGSGGAAAYRFDQLREIANRTQQPMQDVANVYLGISRAAADLGARQSQLVKFTDGLAASLRLSGTSGAAASGALLQLSQMMGGTVVQAQEFNSLVDGAPVLLRAVAEHLGKTGVSMGELRKMVLDGKLATQDFFQAFLKGADELKAKAEAMPSTIGGSFTVLKNSLTDLVGRLDAQYGASRRAADAVLYLAGHLDQAKAIIQISAIALFAYYKQATLIPAAVGLWAAAKNALTAAFVRFQLAAVISGSVLGTLRTELVAANAATLTLTGGVSKLGALLGVLGAAFTGWQIGAILRENFVEAQLAGIAFVNGMLKAWEAVKYGAQVAWAYIGSAWRETVAGMGAGLAGFVGKIADGMAGLGMGKMADGLRLVAQVVAGETTNTSKLADDLAALKTGYDSATTAIDAITGEMADEAIAAFGSAKAHAAVADAVDQHAAAKKQLSDAQKGYLDGLVKEHEKLLDQRVELTQGREAMEHYRAARLGVAAAADKLITANEKLRQGNEALVESEKNMVLWREAIAKATQADTLAALDSSEAIAKEVAKQREHNETIGKTAAQLAALERAKLDDALATAEQNLQDGIRKKVNAETLAALALQVEELRKLKALKEEGVILQTTADAARDAAAEWQKTADSIYNGLTDSLYRAFESGKGFFKTFWDGIRNLFKTTVLRLSIQGVMQSTGLSALAGQAGAAQASGAGGMLGGLGQVGGLLGGSLGAFGSAAGYGASALFGGTGLTALSGGAGMLGAGSVASGLGMMAGVLGPIAAAAGLLYMGLKSGKKETTGSGVEGTASAAGFEGLAYTDWQKKGGFLRGTKRGRDSSGVGAGVEGVLDAGIAAAYATAGEYARVLGLPVEAVKGYSAQFKVAWGKTEEENKAAIEAAVGKLGAGLAGVYASALAPFQKAGEELAQTFERLARLQVFTDSLSQLGGVFARIAGLSVDARESIIGLAGGMEAFGAQAQSFVENYYSAAEQAGIKSAAISKTLADAGVTAALPATREAFRALVEASDMTTEAGRRQFAALMSVSGAFAELVPATEAVAQAGEAATQALRSAADIARERYGLETQLLQLQGDTDALRTRELAGLDASNQALQQRIWALADEQAAAQAAAAIASQRYGLETQLLQLQGDTVALRARELAGLDPANRALQEHIWALSDEQAAASSAAQAAQSLAAAAGGIANERYGLETQLLQLQGDTASLRARELAALDPANRALQEQVWSLQDQQAAANVAAQAAEAAAAQARQLASAWEQAGRSIADEVSHILGLLGAGGTQSAASAQAAFATATAQARAGDQGAAMQLSSLAEAMLAADAASATSSVQLALRQSQTAASLAETLRLIGQPVPGYASGGAFGGGLRIVGESGPELEATGPSRIWNAQQTASMLYGGAPADTAALERLVEALTTEVQMLRAEARATATSSAKTAKILDRVTQGSDSLQTTTAP